MQSLREAQRTGCSIVDSFGIPAIHMDVIMNPVKPIEHFDIPLFAIPHRGAPPVTRCAPGAAGSCNRTMYPLKRNPGGRTVAQLDGGVKRRPETTKSDRWMNCGTQWMSR